MSQQIWNTIIIAHVILDKNRALECGVCIYTSPGGIPCVPEHLSSSDGTGGDSGRGGNRLREGAPLPLRLQHVCGYFAVPILAMKAAVWWIFANHFRLSFDHSLHLVMPRKLNTPHRLFSDFGMRFLD
jgi:hypothetical protein